MTALRRTRGGRSGPVLAIDIGNTETTMGVFRSSRLAVTARASTLRRSVDETFFLISSLLHQNGYPLAASRNPFSGSILASVVPDVTSTWKAALRRFGPKPLDLDDPEVRAPVSVEYRPPWAVGADRIANAAAAHALYRAARPKIVVDFGTATTADCVSKSGVYLGGAIYPGVEISTQSLFERTARLPRIEFAPVRSAVGRDTRGSIQAGLFYGVVGAVREIVSQMEKEIGRAFRIGTGGLAPLVCPAVGGFDAVDSDLTLRGIKLLYDIRQTRRPA
ncbi:type III pantothenate kinase [bacterium]|nr:type III pantothenate kinase [bacterium]